MHSMNIHLSPCSEFQHLFSCIKNVPIPKKRKLSSIESSFFQSLSMSDPQNSSRSGNQSVSDACDAATVDFVDYTNQSFDFNNLDAASLNGVPYASDAPFPVWSQLCTCQSLIFDLYRRLIIAETLISNLQYDSARDSERLTIAEARQDKQ
jgi:hypothetical protein